MKLIAYILGLIFNLIIYLIPSLLLLKRRKISVISVRSPKLLTINNLGGFLMTSTYISYEMINNMKSSELNEDNLALFCKILPNNYLIFHFMLMISFILRCHRIIQCCKINIDERAEINQFYNNRYLFKESYYVKILFFVIVIITFITLLMNLAMNNFMIIPYHFKACMKNPDQSIFISLLWVLINFIEHMILVTYTYLIFTNNIKLLVKLELFSFLIIWILYPNTLRVLDLIVDLNIYNSKWNSIICVIFLYLCLIVNGYLPLFFSYGDKESISFHYNSKLANNLYTYLTNEKCYYSLLEYFKDQNSEENIFMLNLYIDISKYKLKYSIENEYLVMLREARFIYNKYFFDNTFDDFIDKEVLNKTRNVCNQSLSKDEISYDMYDDALIYAFENLKKVFKKYKKSEIYQILIDNLNLNSYIQCKMCNTGLINKF